ncbi:type II toxin-antitoxin system VapC family toxin [Kutzneria sp. NPDC052558]|uniref:type II toxin-antitoxin system VapC family toxin n=1 Tax=Kutzneria sp. NPDC052558 TaxID=3364121 RepID=UPI0037CA02E4
MIYLDSAAIVKLAHVEPGSEQLVDWLNDRRNLPLVTSSLAEVEVPRALRRNAPGSLPAVPTVLGRLYRLAIDSVIRATAATYTDPNLRSLDAIHLATAQFVAGQPGTRFEAFVTYDKRLLEAVKAAGLPIASPGQP